ncbi:hypothetical protein BaRGS_00005598 [Batillaria attramentaria]|uniref:Uncharacterized protein n=1 Tax=Batillaria attramentaria TaxID=370345 RepID=A0ABD0LUK1_9CAEN
MERMACSTEVPGRNGLLGSLLPCVCCASSLTSQGLPAFHEEITLSAPEVTAIEEENNFSLDLNLLCEQHMTGKFIIRSWNKQLSDVRRQASSFLFMLLKQHSGCCSAQSTLPVFDEDCASLKAKEHPLSYKTQLLQMPCVYSRQGIFVGRDIPNASNFEINRLATFSQWPHNHTVFAADLAKTGFHSTGYGDEVECVFCRFVHRNWRFGQKPGAVHRANSPHCLIFHDAAFGNQAAPNIHFNIPLPRVTARAMINLSDPLNILLGNFFPSGQPGGIQETGSTAVDHDVVPPFPGVDMRPRPANVLRTIGIPTGADGTVPFTARYLPEEAVYPTFSSHQKRQQSFQGFPQRRGVRTRCFWEAGFFYTGHQDILICHHCGLNLYRWLHGEDPAIAHARWKPSCPYLINWRGIDFIRIIQRELEVLAVA